MWILLALLLALPAAPASASWAASAPTFEVEGTGLDREDLFARIDSLESIAGDLDDAERARATWRLAQLYIATGMTKHRRHALDLLDEVVELDPDNPDPHWLWAELASAMQYYAAVRDRMQRAIESHPDRVESRIVLASSEFRHGIQRMSEERLRYSREVWRAAVDVDSTRPEVWRGLATSALALGEYRTARRAARSLGRTHPELGLLIEAAAHHRLDDDDLAWPRFEEALDLVGDDARQAFRRGQGFLDADDLASIAETIVPRPQAFAILRGRGQPAQPGDEIDWAVVLEDPAVRAQVLAEWWTLFDRRPAQQFSTGELEYWTRLVEADLFFGRPADGVRGWVTPPGDVWVRWGRPTSTYYDPGGSGGGSRLDALAAAGVRFPPDTYLPPNSPPIWVWTYRWPGSWTSFLFADASRTSRWTPSESSARHLARARAELPVRLPEELPGEAFDLAVSAVSFPRAGSEAVVETHVALEPTVYLLDLATPEQEVRMMYTDRDTLAVVEWSVVDEAGTRIDSARRIVGPTARRSWILGRLGRTAHPAAADPFLVAIGARLPAGRYRFGVEVTEPVTGAVSSSSFPFRVNDPEPGGLLELSGLELCAAFAPLPRGRDVPPEFVKHAAAVVPVPDHRVPVGASRLGVYFEVRNLAQDAGGLTSFDVTYAVYRSTRGIRDLAFQERPDPEELELVAPASLRFLEESTGRSAEGLVVKGTELDVSSLEPGDYVLVVTIDDRISADSRSRPAAFRVSSP